jgi:hypothetical protein
MRLKRLETGANNYTAKNELVPSRGADYNCGACNITVASVKVGGSNVSIGGGGRSWAHHVVLQRGCGRLGP